MFLINKHTPKDVNDVLFHQDIYELLKNMAKDDAIPHIIIHGVSGTGKKTMVNILLKLLYGDSIFNTYQAEYPVTGSGNKTNREILTRSNNHIIIKPYGTNYDRYLLESVTKEYLRTMEFSNSNKSFRVIQIDNLDNFAYFAQTSLRRTIENYSKRCRFIMWCESLSKVIDPIRSRCVCIRLPVLTEKEMAGYISNILAIENKSITLDALSKIVQNSNGHVKKALWNVDMHLRKIPFRISYDYAIVDLVDVILSLDIGKTNKAREIFFRIYITNIPYIKMIEDITKELMCKRNISEIEKIELAMSLSIFEYRVAKARRSIHHFDNFLNDVRKIMLRH